jgi:transcriptional regulator with XRE-family HTH domain
VESTLLARRGGTRLDAAQLDHQLAIRGVTQRRFSEVAGLPEVTLSQARHGRPVAARTLAKIAAALVMIPVLPGGADLLVVAPEKKNAEVGQSTPAQEVAGGTSTETSGRA